MRQLNYHPNPFPDLVLAPGSSRLDGPENVSRGQRSFQQVQQLMVRTSLRLCAILAVLAATIMSLEGCRGKDVATPPVATPSVTTSRDKVPLGSPIDLTYKFVVASDARFDQDYTVMLHVVDSDEQLMWTDDHTPPTPTTQWQPGQTIEYRRTIFVPVYPYVGEATLQVGLYSRTTQKRLALIGDDVGQRAYKVARIQLQPQTENVFVIRKDGWHNTEVADHNGTIEWQWTKRRATLAFKNPKVDATLYLELDNPGGAFTDQQQVRVSLGNQLLDSFVVAPKQPQILRKIPIKAAQFAADDTVEIEIAVDKTFVPSVATAGASKDTRELGVRVFHAFLQPAR
jgi:hypothetical protein